jgi:dihydropteroate synthase
MRWQTSRFLIDLTQPKVMGIINLTPDSFSDGKPKRSVPQVLHFCEQLLADGADILDIGGESTRPGAEPLGLSEELLRLLPVLREAVKLGVPVSVDTYKPQVMQAALDLGADIINDIWALRWHDGGAGSTGAEILAAHASCGVCLMHMHGDPKTMQVHPMQGDVLPKVLLFLERSAQALQALGIEKQRIVIDPGIGFGKTVEQNFSLLAGQHRFTQLTYPLLIGWSRKSSLAGMGVPGSVKLSAQERLAPSLAAALLAAQRGAKILRVHDVKETVQVLRVLEAANNPTIQPKESA